MRPTALVVDDHPTFRRMACLLPTAAGFSGTWGAADAAAVVLAFRRSRPVLDVLALDSGINVAHQIAGLGAPAVLTFIRSDGELGRALWGQVFWTKAELTVERLRGLASDD